MARPDPECPNSILAVRVTLRSSRPGIGAWEGGVLHVNLSAPPVRGRANRELVRVIAGGLGIAPFRAEVVSGATRREKRVRILGVSQEDLESWAAQFKCGGD